MKLKELRKENHKTQVEISKLLNVAPTTYSGYELETSEPNIETLIKLANYYGVSIDYLIGHETNGFYFTAEQSEFIKVYLSLNQQNQNKLSGYALGLLAGQDE